MARKASRSPLFYRKVAGGLAFINDERTILGDIFYVDSNHAAAVDSVGAGTHPDKPFATTDFAIGQCTADQGDVILLAPSHAETLTAKIAADVAGISIIGLGLGTNRPQLTINANIDGIDVTAKNVRLKNLYFNESTNANTSSINVAAEGCLLEDMHFDIGANDLTPITVTAAGERLTLKNPTVDVTANGLVSLIKFEGVVDGFRWEGGDIIGSDGTDGPDNGIIDYNSQAVTNPSVRGVAFHGQGQAITVVANAGSVVGEAMGPNRYSGTAVGADNVSEGLWGTLTNTGGTADLGAILGDMANADVKSRMHPRTATGEADIDDDAADYTTFQNLLTITPAAAAPIEDLTVHLDLAKATTGFVAVYTTSRTIQFAVARKIDGTNWRRDIDSATTARAEDLSGLQGVDIAIGTVGINEEVRIEVVVSAEEGTDVEIPFSAEYKSPAAATFTPVAAA